jgi:hypothetical protein
MPRVNIAIEPKGKGFRSTVTHLREAGLKVEQELETLGIVTGTVSEKDRAKISRVTGVSGVEDEGESELPPPDAKVQ